MIRNAIKISDHLDPEFRWRGEDVSRVENLSDIVFALALGMIVSFADPPQTMSELNAFLFGIIPVSAAFAVLIGVWLTHYKFFRRYGFSDGTILFYNSVLLFTILFIAYPLRFAFDSFFSFMIGVMGDYSRIMAMELSFEASGLILAYFGVAYAIIHILFALMHRHMLKRKDILELNDAEITLTKRSLFQIWAMVALSVLMAALALLTPLNGMAGFILFGSWGVDAIARRRHPLETAP